MEEPSVLDYLIAKLTPWRGAPPVIPNEEPAHDLDCMPPETDAMELEPRLSAEPIFEPQQQPISRQVRWPWKGLVVLVLALLAQSALEPPNRSANMGVVFYLLAGVGLVWAIWHNEWGAVPLPEEEYRQDPLTTRPKTFLISILLAVFAFVAFGGNRFTSFNILLWALAVVAVLKGLWLGTFPASHWLERLGAGLSRRQWSLNISRWTLVWFVAAALVIFFRVYRLSEVPPEMVSDHAEKLLDVGDVLNGQTSIFFPRNTGREGFQMYLTAAVASIFGTGLSFLSLKIGTVLFGLLTLPYIYLLGKEVGNPQVGLWAMVFAGIAYWPNVISRIALRFTFYPFFVAPTLLYLVRGLRRRNRNDFILSGLFLGLGLHGYSPFRFVPIVLVIAVGLYLLHRQSENGRKQAVMGLFVLALVSLFIFLPLLRYWLSNPDMFSYRAMTRMGSLERPLPGPVWEIFLKNLWNAMRMFAWDNGEVWVHSITHRPALDIVSGALFHLGLVLLFVRYLRQRHWLDLFLIISIPLLLMPSILSLAFPSENPSLNRTAGVLVPVFLIVGIALEGLVSTLKSRLGSMSMRYGIGWGLVIFLLFWSSLQNYDLVFNKYQSTYEISSWNTSEMGQLIRNFADSVGSQDTAWVVAYPHWVDTRLVGINASYPTKDFAIWPENFQDTVADPRGKLFLINIQDETSLEQLQQIYPQGVLQEYTSRVETKDFLMFFVPPRE